MKRSVFETILGAVVLLIAVSFLYTAYTKGDVKADMGGDSYDLIASFNRVDGLREGADVRIAGVKVGNVSKLTLDPVTYQAVGVVTLAGDVKVPTDTVAQISSEGLLGGKYLSLEIGGAAEVLPAGGKFEYTQAAPNLEQLLGQVIFNSSQNKAAEAAPAAPAPVAQ